MDVRPRPPGVEYENSTDGALTYDYDAAGQLLEVSGILNDEYEYDGNGNRVSQDHVTDAPNRLVDDGRYLYEYDDEGNLTKRTEVSSGWIVNLTWDHRNRLTQVTESSPTSEIFKVNYQYDAFNRRIQRTKTVEVDGGEGQNPEYATTGEVFFYDGQHVVLDFFRPDGGNYALAKRYLYGPAVDQVLAQENVAEGINDPERVYWMLTDNQGTVRDLMDHEGNLVEHYEYDAFGRVLAGNTSLTRYLYTAREFDQDTKLQYNRNRWYDTYTGRWLSEDPIGFEGDPSNLYRYVGNGPANWIDPYGLREEPHGQNCTTHNLRAGIQMPNWLEQWLKKAGIVVDFDIEVFGQYESCASCCSSHPTHRNVSGSLGASVSVYGQNGHWDYGIVSIDVGAYVRGTVSGELFFSYDGCADQSSAGGSITVSIEGGGVGGIAFKLLGATAGGGVRIGGGISATLSIECTGRQCDITLSAVFEAKAEFSAYLRYNIWGFNGFEYSYEAVAAYATGKHSVYQFTMI